MFPETKGVDSYKDITPRMGAAYDVFGNGKTALKVNVGKYLEGAGIQLNYANPNPTAPAAGRRAFATHASRGPGPTRTATSSPTAIC